MPTDQYGDLLPTGAVARLGSLRFGQGQRVNGLAFSPDAKMLAAGGDDGTVHLWNLTTGKQISRLPDQSDKISAVAFSPDGKTVVSSSLDGNTYFWDAASGRAVRQLQVAAGGALLLGFSADGKMLTYAAPDGTIRTLDAVTGKEKQQQPGAVGPAHALSLAPDGKTLASGNWEITIRLWEVGTGKELGQLAGHRMQIRALSFAPNGKTIASGGDEEGIRLTELLTGKERGKLPGHKGAILALAFSPDGKTLASSGADTTILLWDITGRSEEGPRKPATLMTSQLESLWSDLVSDDAVKAYRNMWQICSYAKQALPLFKNKMRLLVPADRQRVTTLLGELNHDQVPVREKATQMLEKLGILVEPALQGALQKQPGLETRRRLEKLLKKLEDVPTGDSLHAYRLVEALELTGNAEARQMLEGLARETPPTRITHDAKAALQRLAKRPVTP